MVSNITLVMSNLVDNSPGGRYCLGAEDLAQISVYSNKIQSKSVSNFTIQLSSIRFYQHPECYARYMNLKFSTKIQRKHCCTRFYLTPKWSTKLIVAPVRICNIFSNLVGVEWPSSTIDLLYVCARTENKVIRLFQHFFLKWTSKSVLAKTR